MTAGAPVATHSTPTRRGAIRMQVLEVFGRGERHRSRGRLTGSSSATASTCSGTVRQPSMVGSVVLGVAMAAAVVGVAPGRAAATVPAPAATWTQQHPATSPTGRHSASMAYDQATGDAALFGGVGSSGSYRADTWTWTWNGTTWNGTTWNGTTWTQECR